MGVNSPPPLKSSLPIAFSIAFTQQLSLYRKMSRHHTFHFALQVWIINKPFIFFVCSKSNILNHQWKAKIKKKELFLLYLLIRCLIMSVGSQGLGKEDAYKHDYFYRTKAAAILGLLTNTSLEWVGQRRSTKEMTSCSYFFLLALGFIRVLHTHTHTQGSRKI